MWHECPPHLPRPEKQQDSLRLRSLASSQRNARRQRVRLLPSGFASAPKRWVALIMTKLRRRPAEVPQKCARCPRTLRNPGTPGALCNTCIGAMFKRGA